MGLSETISDYLGLTGTIWEYLSSIKAGESKLLLFETFWFFSHTGSIEELALLIMEMERSLYATPLLSDYPLSCSVLKDAETQFKDQVKSTR